MPVYSKSGSAIDFRHVTHAWVTDQPYEVNFSFVGGGNTSYTGALARKMWEDYCGFLNYDWRYNAQQGGN